jgi:hypothetical protein
MPGLWKAWKAKNRLPPLPTNPLGIRQTPARFPHSHSSDDEGVGKVENQDQVSHFATAPNPLSQHPKTNRRAGFALRRTRHSRRLHVVVVNREK